jgi:hypothetical protein
MIMDTIDFISLPEKAQANLNRLSTRVAGVVPVETKTWEFAVNQLQADTYFPTIVLDVAHWASKGNIYLYIIRLVTEDVDLSNLENAFSTAKAKKNGRAYPRLNSPSRCFYVGSSRNVRQRLKDHLGYGAKSTFGLHLAHWASGLPIELEFTCAKYQAGLDPQVYQALEDTLWDEMSPMFGRKGAK